MQRLFLAVLLGASALLLAACTQAPTVPVEDPAMLHPKPVTTAPPQPPTRALQTLPEPAPPTQSAMPAIPPKAPAATSVGSASGSVAPSRGQMSAAQIATNPSVTPSGTTRYECVKGNTGSEKREAIVFPENSGRICARFPAMGPCQYERDACRANGGRVIRFDGAEITKDVEKEYDKQVQRFRLNAG